MNQQPTIQLQVVNPPGQTSAANAAGGIPLGFVTVPQTPPAGAGAGAADSGGGSIDLIGIFWRIVSKWWIILLSLVFALGLAWLYLQKTTPLYVSEGAVKVEQRQAEVLPIPVFNSENYDKLEYLNTVEQSITANTRLLNVAQSLNLQESPQFVAARKEGRPLNKTEILRVMRGKVETMVRRGSYRVIDVYVSDPDPAQAKRIADALIAEALSSASQDNFDAAMKIRKALESQVDEGRNKLERSQKAVDDYQAKFPNLPLDRGSDALTEKSRSLLNELTKLETERASFQASVDMILSVDRNSLQSLMQLDMVANSPEVVQLMTQINLQTAAFASLQERYLYKHPKYKKAQAELEQLQQAGLRTAQTVLDATRRKFERSLEKEKAIRASLDLQNAEEIELIRILGPYKLLKQTRDDDRDLLEQIQKRIKETDVTKELASSKLSIFSPPLIPDEPSDPKPKVIYAMAGAGGITLALGIIFVLGIFDRSLKSASEAERFLQMPALTAIPRHPVKELAASLITKPDGPGADSFEAFRSLRTSLSFLGKGADAQSFVFTSARPNEGKSFCAMNYAVTLARLGYRTLLIDADLRQPDLDNVFLKEENPTGLATHLSASMGSGNACNATEIQDLYLLSAGETDANPAELLADGRFDLILKDAAKWFHKIVIDTPPLNAVSDALLIARHVDSVCMVVGSKTPRAEVQRACNRLTLAGNPAVGFVYNFASGSATSYAAVGDYIPMPGSHSLPFGRST